MGRRIGRATLQMDHPPCVQAWAAVGGKKEQQGPLGYAFDRTFSDTLCGQKSWEQAEIYMQRTALALASNKCTLPIAELDMLLAGDLLAQCIVSGYAAREAKVPYIGLYGACSTMAESLAVGACMIDGGFARRVGAAASSHFCTAERQYRFPLAYGGQRPPTAQWTATAAGACILTDEPQKPVHITKVCFGKVCDLGIKDANNMGAAMAPAAHDTIQTLLQDTGTKPQDYDGIFTGDLGKVGSRLFCALFERDGIDIKKVHEDCGKLLFDDKQGVQAGASGCGCAASVLCTQLLPQLERGAMHRIILAATGALMSPTSVQQGESIPGICHAVVLESGGKG